MTDTGREDAYSESGVSGCTDEVKVVSVSTRSTVPPRFPYLTRTEEEGSYEGEYRLFGLDSVHRCGVQSLRPCTTEQDPLVYGPVLGPETLVPSSSPTDRPLWPDRVVSFFSLLFVFFHRTSLFTKRLI